MSDLVSDGGLPGQVLVKKNDNLFSTLEDYAWEDASGGITVVGRGPTQGLEYDLPSHTLWAPLATDELAGSITEPPPDGQNYVRMRDTMFGSSWVLASTSVLVQDYPPTNAAAGALWWDSDSGNLFVNYQDIDSTQFVQINIAAPSMAGDYLPLTGGTVTGDLVLNAGGGLVYWQKDADEGVFVRGCATDGSHFADIRCIAPNGFPMEGQFEFWIASGDWATKQLAFRTAMGSPPGIYVNGACSALTMTDRTLMADPELAEFGGNIGEMLKHALGEIKALKAELEALRGR